MGERIDGAMIHTPQPLLTTPGKGSFGAFTLWYRVRRLQAASPRTRAVRRRPRRSTLLDGSVGLVPYSLSARYGPHPIVAEAPPVIPAPARKRHRRILPA